MGLAIEVNKDRGSGSTPALMHGEQRGAERAAVAEQLERQQAETQQLLIDVGLPSLSPLLSEAAGKREALCASWIGERSGIEDWISAGPGHRRGRRNKKVSKAFL